ncbi:hypothetical protein KB236_01865 [Levilactobacillus brevis]|uniref:Transcriptional regulator n=1 Tax=Levilactobacillus hammesii TaxID=267633 RepID=A0A921JWR2_9LACO|nr:hypothetical protein KB236_01865 [Levilactobacillus brevis]HJE87099.1 hypothetical protein [Levilactobacillus hammesii]
MMKIETFHFLENILRDYPRSNRIIADYEESLRSPYRDGRDENVGGGRMQNNRDDRVENMAISIATDRTLRNLHLYQETVSRVLGRSDPDTRAIIDLLYFHPANQVNISGVAMRMHMGRTAVSRRRAAFFKMLARELGYLY